MSIETEREQQARADADCDDAIRWWFGQVKEAITAEHLHENTGSDDDIAYDAGVDDALSALASVAARLQSRP